MQILKARLVRLFGYGLALAGLVPVLYLFTLVAAEFSSRAYGHAWRVPTVPAAWLAQIQAWPPAYIGAAVALIGLLVTAIGALLAIRQGGIIRTEERLREDRLRRVRLRQYGEDGRVEPFIGPGILAANTEDGPVRNKEEAA